MVENKRIHIIKRADGWVVRGEAENRASRKYNTKIEAIAFVRDNIKGPFQLVVHKMDGTVEEWLSVFSPDETGT